MLIAETVQGNYNYKLYWSHEKRNRALFNALIPSKAAG
jgi:hypothetical protein